VAIALGVAILIYVVFFGESDEDAIRERLDLLEATIEVKGTQENLVIRGARIKEAFTELFVKDVTIQIPELTQVKTGRTELTGLAARAPSWYRTASVDLGGLRVDVGEQAVSAHVSGLATLTATRLTGELSRDTRTVSLRFDKIEGDWKIVSLSVSAKEEVDE
jgi:hypothetical protein